jgi:hypothetical protein
MTRDAISVVWRVFREEFGLQEVLGPGETQLRGDNQWKHIGTKKISVCVSYSEL